MIKIFARLRQDERGIAALEVAFIMPFLLFLYFGLVDLTAMISLNRKVTYASSVVADLVTQNDSTVLATDIDDYFNAAALVMKPTPMTNIRVDVYQYRSEAGLVVSKWHRNSPDGADCDPPDTTGMQALMTDGNDLIIAVVCTTYAPYIASFLGKSVLGATSFTMNEQIALRPRQSSTLECTGCT